MTDPRMDHIICGHLCGLTQHGHESYETDHEFEAVTDESHYSGAISVFRHAEEQGFPIHVATHSTCAEHIEEGDDKAESWALQPSLVLDADRLGQVIYEMGIDDLDLPDAHKLAAHIVTRLEKAADE